MLRHIQSLLTRPRPRPVPVAAATTPRNHWPLDQKMVRLTPWDYLTTRDLCEGTLVIGNTGSGKSSTTGTIIATSALRSGWGIAVFAAKPDDAAYWQELCRSLRQDRSDTFPAESAVAELVLL